MSNSIVEVKFGSGNIYYGIFSGYDGSILSWRDLKHLLEFEDPVLKYKAVIDLYGYRLSEETIKQLDSDGTALFTSIEEAYRVMELIEDGDI